jgi:hypothetical protein
MAQLAGSNVLTWICMAVLLSAAGMLLFRTQRHFARQVRTPMEYDPPERAPARRAEPASDAIERWEIEMHDLARELSARLDSKMSVLEHLIREADRAAARLESALAAAGPGARVPSVPPEAQRANQAAGLLAGTSAGGDTPDEGRPRPAHAGRYDEIYLMADYGHPAGEIAKKLGLPIGEVELILSLRTRR